MRWLCNGPKMCFSDIIKALSEDGETELVMELLRWREDHPTDLKEEEHTLRL